MKSLFLAPTLDLLACHAASRMNLDLVTLPSQSNQLINKSQKFRQQKLDLLGLSGAMIENPK